MIITAPIKASSSELLRILCFEYGIKWGISIISISIILGTFSLIFDYRWIIIALIWIFIITPFSIFFLYIVYGLRPVTSYNVLTHRLCIDRTKIVIEFLKTEEDVSAPTPQIELKGLNKIKYDYNSLILMFDNKIGWLLLPIKALENKKDIEELMKILTSYTLIDESKFINHEVRRGT